MRSLNKAAALISALTVFLLTSCVSAVREKDDPFTYKAFSYNSSKCVLVTIDLTNENLELVSYPGTKAGEGKAFHAKKTTKFARENGLFVAVNANPFIKPSFFSSLRKNVGIYKCSGIQISNPNSRYAALLFDKDLGARIVESQTQENVGEAENAFGGFFMILENGRKKNFRYESRNKRLAAGLDQEGKNLFLLYAEKLTYPECAEVLMKHGCSDALEFDGGSSAEMAVYGSPVENNILNVPQASSFGFRMREAEIPEEESSKNCNF